MLLVCHVSFTLRYLICVISLKKTCIIAQVSARVFCYIISSFCILFWMCAVFVLILNMIIEETLHSLVFCVILCICQKLGHRPKMKCAFIPMKLKVGLPFSLPLCQYVCEYCFIHKTEYDNVKN